MAAMATIRRPDIFQAGVAGAPVADWRDYDTHYTERFLGLPDTEKAAYDTSSVLTYAKELKRPLLIIHGTADDNVYLTHALKLSNALFAAGKPHDFLPLAGQTHMVSDPKVSAPMYARIVAHLRSHLGRPQPGK
jgi:dipeptidyl-peptidase-4